MKSEILQKIGNHLETLGYRIIWFEEESDSPYFLCNHESHDKINWLCADFHGGVHMQANYATGDKARKQPDDFMRAVNSISDRPGPVSYTVEDGDTSLNMKMFVMFYDETAFGNQLELASFQMRAQLSSEEISGFML